MNPYSVFANRKGIKATKREESGIIGNKREESGIIGTMQFSDVVTLLTETCFKANKPNN